MHILILLVMAIVVVYFITIMKKRDNFSFGGDYSHLPSLRGDHLVGELQGDLQKWRNWQTTHPEHEPGYHPMLGYWYNKYNGVRRCMRLQDNVCEENPNSKLCQDKSFCFDPLE